MAGKQPTVEEQIKQIQNLIRFWQGRLQESTLGVTERVMVEMTIHELQQRELFLEASVVARNALGIAPQ